MNSTEWHNDAMSHIQKTKTELTHAAASDGHEIPWAIDAAVLVSETIIRAAAMISEAIERNQHEQS